MILQSLHEYYQRKAADPESKIPPQGFGWKEIPFLIVIDKDGNFINLESVRVGASRKDFLVLKTRGRSGANSWQTSNVLWDHYGYVLACPKDNTGKAKVDAQKQHSSFLAYVNELTEKYPLNEQFKAVKKFYEREDQRKDILKHEYWNDCYKISGCNLSFKLVGETKLVAEHEDLKSFVICDKKDEGESKGTGPINNTEGICLITGERGEIAVLHTATSVPGGKSGGKLVGFQKNSGYDSYYKEQGLNAPVSKKAEDAYTTALNTLLSKDSKNKFKITDTIVLFWAEKKTDFEKYFPFFFACPQKDDPDRNSQEIKTLFESIRSGKLNADNNNKFYILGLAPNAARISVRFWKIRTVKEFGESIAQHFEDLEIVRGKKDEHEYFSLFNLLTSIVLDYKMDNVPPNLTGALIASILDGTPYPATLQQQCIRRIRAEQHVTRVRAAILKAYLNKRNRCYKKNEKEITMALDPTNTNQGYLTGRLFAVLEKIQEEAQPGINSTIKDRYYGAASSTPVIVMPRLLGLSSHHLGKLNPGRKFNLERLVGEIINDIDGNKNFPAHMSLDDQSRFAIGYYHQRQDLFTKK
ncbi:MAG: type I-C CRISPR-associated protein Cas8c/Csd1 [Candidatus Margulisiibacteriota bacterium]|nr:MAG: type I-C CRISPR-associated protein Cas8c/Csd1 [Candidatus Margulisiibacteriota bacterium]HCY36067.1 type I-C CRISPR-associated protein Cas8c/Csd1 [Candidatus Margulisiibacteriota bacterium]